MFKCKKNKKVDIYPSKDQNFQAATQINEQTLSFLPRLLVTLGSIMYLGGWLINEFTELFHSLFMNIPTLIG